MAHRYNIVTSISVDVKGGAKAENYPLMGNVSAQTRALIYWKMAALLMVSSRLANPGQRHLVLTNDEGAVMDGDTDLRQYLAEQGVEVVYVSFEDFVMPPGVGGRFANAFYKLECHKYLATLDTPSILLDTDVVWAHHSDELDAKIASGVPMFYDSHNRDPDSKAIVGTSRREFGAMFKAIDPSYDNEIPVTLGGEATTGSPRVWAELNERLKRTFKTVTSWVQEGRELPGGESRHHWLGGADVILHMEYNRQPGVAYISPWHKRFYNLGFLSNLEPGDERLPIWHLPGEKHRGLKNLYAFMMERDRRFWNTDEETRAKFLGDVVAVPKRRIGRATDPSWLQDQIRIARGYAGRFKGILKQKLGMHHK